MSLIDRVLSEPEFVQRPPVLVDVGAAGGVSKLWWRISRHCVVVAFEPDARESAPLTAGQRRFRRWIYVPAIAVPARSGADGVEFHLTRSPQCSSSLPPRADRLERWAFAPLFEVVECRRFPAITLAEALAGAGLPSADWLKCDTQGTDLRLFQSLLSSGAPAPLVAEFEPGMIEAYEGEDSVEQILAHMGGLEYWLSAMDLQTTPRAPSRKAHSTWLRRLGPGAPGWANLQYLRELPAAPALLGRRDSLLLWTFATLLGQPAFALEVAEAAGCIYGGALFAEMARDSLRRLRWHMCLAAPGWLCRRLLARL